MRLPSVAVLQRRIDDPHVYQVAFGSDGNQMWWYAVHGIRPTKNTTWSCLDFCYVTSPCVPMTWQRDASIRYSYQPFRIYPNYTYYPIRLFSQSLVPRSRRNSGRESFRTFTWLSYTPRPCSIGSLTVTFRRNELRIHGEVSGSNFNRIDVSLSFRSFETLWNYPVLM